MESDVHDQNPQNSFNNQRLIQTNQRDVRAQLDWNQRSGLLCIGLFVFMISFMWTLYKYLCDQYTDSHKEDEESHFHHRHESWEGDAHSGFYRQLEEVNFNTPMTQPLTVISNVHMTNCTSTNESPNSHSASFEIMNMTNPPSSSQVDLLDTPIVLDNGQSIHEPLMGPGGHQYVDMNPPPYENFEPPSYAEIFAKFREF